MVERTYKSEAPAESCDEACAEELQQVQQAKRRHWFSQQTELMSLCDQNQPNFWKKIGKVGIAQERQKGIPMEVVLADGSVSTDVGVVQDEDVPVYPDPVNGSDELNSDITCNEIRQALNAAKTGKAIGVDSIPVEVVKNPTCAQFMLHLFNACFKSGCIPDTWGEGIIAPIQKDMSKDNRDPGNHRVISIAPAMYKLYCYIVNNRLNKYVTSNGYMANEENGFMKGKSTIDQLSTLTNLIETRKLQKKDTYVAFIDFSKAYDRINRTLLWKKLGAMGIQGRMLRCLQSLYSNVTSCVKLSPSVLTDWFKVGTGLRQGCIVSPILFNLYINDMAVQIKNKCKGVPVGNDNVCILMYADDVALMAESEKELQRMLDVLHKWCQTWDVLVNSQKSQIVHYR